MKPTSPHDPLDDLIAAALHGDLSPAEQTQFDARLKNDSAARAAYEKAKLMDNILDNNFKAAQPDSAFEQRMVSGVRRRIKDNAHSETPLESLLLLWIGLKRVFVRRRRWEYGLMTVILLLLVGILWKPVYNEMLREQGYADYDAAFYGVPVNVANPNGSGEIYDKVPILGDLPLVGRLFQSKVSQEEVDNRRAALVAKSAELKAKLQQEGVNYVDTAQKGITLPGYVDTSATEQFGGKEARFNTALPGSQGFSLNNIAQLQAIKKTGTSQWNLSAGNTYTGGTSVNGGTLQVSSGATSSFSGAIGSLDGKLAEDADGTGQGHGQGGGGGDERTKDLAAFEAADESGLRTIDKVTKRDMADQEKKNLEYAKAEADYASQAAATAASSKGIDFATTGGASIIRHSYNNVTMTPPPPSATPPSQLSDVAQKWTETASPDIVVAQASPSPDTAAPSSGPQPAPAADTTPDPSRKLIRNAQMDLEVKSFQIAMDEIATLTRQAGGYVDTSNSQRGGNGKLQGTVVVKVLPQHLDEFLLELRNLGEVKNQSVSTDDVTKDYFDTQARLVNSQKMEVQLQDLLKRENSKVADLLAVERELGRVRGDIEQMQGQLKLYDFQVAYATVTMQMREKDLNQAAAYLLKENDNFSLFATDVETTFQQARHAADDFKAQILVATLNHNSGSDVSAQLIVSVPPDQIDAFLAQVRTLGRVDNFTRETKRTAKDGGDSDQPADETMTEKDKVLVNIAIKSDDESRQQVAMTVVTKAVDDALDQAKKAALATAGVEILSSSLNKAQEGQSSAQLSMRVPGASYPALRDSLKLLGRTASFHLQRAENAGPNANGDDAPVIISLTLTDYEAPLQVSVISVLASDVDAQAQQVRTDAATSGVEVKSSNFEREPNGTELAQMTFRMPMSKYAAFVDSVKKLGKVESLTVRREDRPDQTGTDENAPVEIGLQIHNQGDIVADNSGLMATLRQTFGEGAGALFGSVKTIGVIVAFLAPWVVAFVFAFWVGRRIYLWRKK